MIIKCKHGRKRKYRGSGQRPNQQYSYIGCNAMINGYKNQKTGHVKITKVDLIHNHECRETDYIAQHQEIDESDEAFIVTLNNATARPSQIRRVLKEQRGKSFSTKKIQNLIRKLVPSE